MSNYPNKPSAWVNGVNPVLSKNSGKHFLVSETISVDELRQIVGDSFRIKVFSKKAFDLDLGAEKDDGNVIPKITIMVEENDRKYVKDNALSPVTDSQSPAANSQTSNPGNGGPPPANGAGSGVVRV